MFKQLISLKRGNKLMISHFYNSETVNKREYVEKFNCLHPPIVAGLQTRGGVNTGKTSTLML